MFGVRGPNNSPLIYPIIESNINRNYNNEDLDIQFRDIILLILILEENYSRFGI
jgi:hypothetical protein